MSQDFQPTDEFTEFFFLAIDHGFGSIEDGAGPLIPFAMTVSLNGERKLNRFLTENLEDGLEQARNHVDENRDEVVMYAIAWDGYVTLDHERTDAILVEAGERQDPSGVIFCQRYREVKKGLLRKKKCEAIGNPALIGRPESRFR